MPTRALSTGCRDAPPVLAEACNRTSVYWRAKYNYITR